MSWGLIDDRYISLYTFIFTNTKGLESPDIPGVPGDRETPTPWSRVDKDISLCTYNRFYPSSYPLALTYNPIPKPYLASRFVLAPTLIYNYNKTKILNNQKNKKNKIKNHLELYKNLIVQPIACKADDAR